MPVPYTFGTATAAIPLSNLDANFNTPVTIGNTTVGLGNTVTTLGNVTLTNVTISSGTSNVTNESISGNLTFTGTGNRIIGETSNATIANRLAFQNSTTNSQTALTILPNGTATTSNVLIYSTNDGVNASVMQLRVGGDGGLNGLSAAISGTGTYLPLMFWTGGSERLRIDTSGNVGIGISSPLNRLDVRASSATIDNYQTIQAFSTNSAGADLGGGIALGGYYSGTSAIAMFGSIVGRKSNATAGNFDGYLAFGTNNTSTGVVERMRIDSSGNVSIGTSSPSSRLHVKGTDVKLLLETSSGATSYIQQLSASPYNVSFYNQNAGSLIFGTNDTERMRITSDGDLLVGATAAINSAHVIAKNASNNSTIVVSNTSTSGGAYGLQIRYASQDPNNTASSWLECYSASANVTRAEIRSNGGLANYSANNVNLSDEREKTNIQLAGSYLDKICAIPVKTFNYIDQNIEEDDGLTLGVIAQDVQKVAPELVMEGNWGSKETPKMRLSIYQTDLQYALMKCIQEQQAMIEELKQEVAKLKGV